MESGAENYEIFALRYATANRSAHDNFLVRDMHDIPMPLDYFVWLIRSSTRTILVDSGFNQSSGLLRHRTLLINPADALDRFGVSPASVDDLILTHLHYDHAGNIERFPNARLHVQDAEVDYATGRSMRHDILRRTYDLPDVLELIKRIYASRVEFHNGDGVITGGISVHRTPGHTKGLQVVRVRTARGNVLLASDACHFYQNMERFNPFPMLVDVAHSMESFVCLHKLADSPNHIIPGHDPIVARRYRRMDLVGVEAFALHEEPLDWTPDQPGIGVEDHDAPNV